MKRPLVLITLFYLAGVLAGGTPGIKVQAAFGLALFCFLACVLTVFLERAAPGKNFSGWSFMLLFFSLGLFLSALSLEKSKSPLSLFYGQELTLWGRVVADPDLRQDKVYYLLRVERVEAGPKIFASSGTVRISVREPEQVFSYGDRLLAKGFFYWPKSAGNPGAFDYSVFLQRQGIAGILAAKKSADVKKAGDGPSNPLLSCAYTLKKKMARAAGKALTPGQAAVLNGMIFGVQGQLDKNTRQAFSETGLVHILSVSGLHVGLVLAGVLAVLKLVKAGVQAYAPAATPVLVFYALMTGAGPAVLRSTVMALFLLWAHHLGRQRDWPTTMSLAALFILLIKPTELYNPGFQLSFAATWGILGLGPYIEEILTAKNKSGQKIPACLKTAVQALAVSLAAQLAAVPLVAWHYNLFSLVSVPANLVSLPLLSLIMLYGVLAAFLGLIWLPLAGAVNVVTGALLEAFVQLVQFLHQIPAAAVYVPPPPLLAAAAWYIALLLFAQKRPKGQKPPAKLAGFLLLGLSVLIWWPWNPPKGLTLHFIDVGQGDCTLIQTPGGQNVLIDTGGWREEFTAGSGAGDQVVAPYLRRLGINRLDALILTHPHEDHCGGAAYLTGVFPIKLAVVPPLGCTAEKGGGGDLTAGVPDAYRALLEDLSSHGTKIAAAAAGDTLHLNGGLQIDFLGPPAEQCAPEMAGNPNNTSLVARLCFGGHSFLLTGDIELWAQEELLKSGADLRSNVLKVPHHGSRSLLPQFIEAVQPALAVISVGTHNTFGHPAQSTLEVLSRCGAKVLRTDLHGAVIVHTDGRSMKVKTGRTGVLRHTSLNSSAATFGRGFVIHHLTFGFAAPTSPQC